MQELIYKIVIYRSDGNHLEIFESDKIKEVESMYKGLDHEWTTSTAEKRPFRHPSEMHCFHPSLILEIKVESMSKEEYHKQSNPYYAQMKREGFSGAMNQNFNNGGTY